MNSRNRPDTVRFSGVIHGLGKCDECNWESSSYKNALATAKVHHNITGHTVSVEQAIAVTYALEGSRYAKEKGK